MKKLFKIAILATLIPIINISTVCAADPTNNGVDTQTQSEIQRVLWGAPISPYTRVVMVTLNEKGVPYKQEAILPKVLLDATKTPVPQEFMEISPAGKIPAYEEITNGKRTFSMVESADIMKHIDKTINSHSLGGNSPEEKEEIEELIKYANESVAPLTHGLLMEHVVKPGILKQDTDATKVNDVLTNKLPPVLDNLEKKLSHSQWIAGTKQFSLADIMIVSHLVTLDTAKVDLMKTISTKRPHLLKYVKTVLERESFKKALATLK